MDTGGRGQGRRGGTEIDGSLIQVGGQYVETGSSVSLAEDTHTFRLMPAIFGYAGPGHLYRDENAEVTATTTTLEFEWIMAHPTIRLHDQNGDEKLDGDDIQGLVERLIAP